MKKILILNGPNLNMLGIREPEIYGNQTHDDIAKLCEDTATQNNATAEVKQSNHEGQLIDWIQEAIEGYDGVIINAGGYTHTSVAIHDALKLLSCPVVEVHLSDISKREEFRHFSYISLVAAKVIKGHGADGYVQAIEFICKNS